MERTLYAALFCRHMTSSYDVLSCAQQLGNAVSGRHPLTMDDMLLDIRAGGQLLDLFRFCWALRRNPRTRREWSVVLDSLNATPRPKYCELLLRDTFNLYKVMRLRAGPRLHMPSNRTHYRGYVPHRLAKVMRRHGMFGFTPEDRRNARERAADHVAATWDGLPNERVVLWMDNYYRARYLNNPLRGYSSLNSSVMAVLALTSLPPTAPDVPRFADALSQVTSTAVAIVQQVQRMQALVTLISQRRHIPGEIRVPLDVQRGAVTSLPWTPFRLSEVCVSSQAGLLRFLRFAGHVAQRTQCRVAPLLVDENIHYRVFKLAWSTPFQKWDVPRFLQTTPPLYGIWHAYKYCVLQVAFHSCLWYALRGTLLEGDQVPTNPSLRSYELAFAALLQTPLTLRTRVAKMHSNWSTLNENDIMQMQVVGTHVGLEQSTLVQCNALHPSHPSMVQCQTLVARARSCELLSQFLNF